ncbi:YitT family protein [Acholeplasma hippikon]|uniref:Uncharacterized protein conserved in bacteria (DUF2179) n=1 Tax=Acholeplasma hippikon TaxID=264636 RepID=A0A449BKG9_9MOLU|nr:YitT family protein [Acholeplasma hippikon]VEU82938.1 Uncharacterized protein conserved in bacteria (DUF2179) [Acholeplasma hippikon]
MKSINEFLHSDQYTSKIAPELKRLAAVVFFTVVYGFGVKWFLEASVIPMYTGGIPGISQLIRDFFKYTLHMDISAWEGIFLSAFIIIANIPLMVLGWFGVSKKFVIYSLISVLIQATIIGYIKPIELGLDSQSQALTATILGGILVGLGTGGALRYGTSTGGLDIIAQYLALKNGKSVGFISLTMNMTIALLGGLITGQHLVDNAVIDGVTQASAAAGIVISYTILRQVVSMILTDRMHTAYHFISVDIITDNPNDIISDILTKIYRGVTLVNVQGGYTRKDKTLIKVVISSYELVSLTQLVNHVDPKAFIITQPVKQVFGNFKKKTIA